MTINPLRCRRKLHLPRLHVATATLALSTLSSSIGVGRGRGRGRGRAPALPPLLYESLKSKTQTVKRKNFTLGHAIRLRGVVHCMDCQKPRCIYSAQAIAKMKPHGEHTREEGIDCRCAHVLFCLYFLSSLELNVCL